MRLIERNIRRAVKNAVVGSVASAALLAAIGVQAAPTINRLTPPSKSAQAPGEIISRFLPDQRFDLQATVTPEGTQSVVSVQFFVDGTPVATVTGGAGDLASTSLVPATVLGGNARVASVRAYTNSTPGVHTLRVVARQTDNTTTVREGVFEIVNVGANLGRRAKNVIVLIGDGMGIAHRTAARILLRGETMGKANGPLAMDTFPFTGIVMTGSLNSIVTDSAPGAHCYSTGNKTNNNLEGVFPDDTTAKFDNPRIEFMGEYLYRKYGKTLGIVTTADVFDATPAAFSVHTQDRGAGTGIIDQFLLEGARTNGSGPLRVLMGGGRKWFLPNNTGSTPTGDGSVRVSSSDYVLPGDVVAGWGVPAGTLNPEADVIGQFQTAGFSYAPDRTALNSAGTPDRLLGLFSLSNMNIALDKIAYRRSQAANDPSIRVGNQGGFNPATGKYVVEDYGFPNQPMLDEMATKALSVLNKNPNGFTLMIEGASIDKQAHNMDSDRWMLDTIEFDRAIKVCQDFAAANPDTLVIVTADHECAGVNIIGASKVTNAELQTKAAGNADQAAGVKNLRDDVVGNYDAAGFPQYTILGDGYPSTTDPDRKLLIGYAANFDRYEDWLTNPLPLLDTQQPFSGIAPQNGYPSDPTKRDKAGNFFVTGQVSGGSAVHTASDIPLSAYGRGSSLFTGVMDNTDVFFKILQAVIGGAK